MDPINEKAYSYPWFDLLYDYLVHFGPDGKPSRDTSLAHDWEMSADAMSWTFYIREGVKYSNGQELTAEDVKYSLDRMASPASVAGLSGTWKNAHKSVEVIDKYTVKVNVNSPFPTLDWLLPAVKLSTIGSPKAYFEEKGADYAALNPIGSGPYVLSEFVVGDYVKMEARTDGYAHWRGTPKFETVTFRLIPEETTRLAMLKTGEVDVVQPVSLDRLKELEEGGFKVISQKGASIASVGFGYMWQEDVPIGNAKVREALNLAIDRQEIIDTLLLGRAIANYSPFASWTLDGIDYDKEYDFYPYDPEKAKELISEAGYPDGFTIPMYVHTEEGAWPHKDAALAIAGYWFDIGITVNFIPITGASYFDRRNKFAQLDNSVSIGGVAGQNVTWTLSLATITARFFPPEAKAWHSPRFPQGWDPELEHAANMASEAIDREDANEWMRELNKILRDKHYQIPLLRTDRALVVAPWVPVWDVGKIPWNYQNTPDLVLEPVK